MALQGTLDSFALADVLALVGGTGKIGVLEVTASGHRTLLYLQDGSLVSASVDDSLCDPADTVLWLFRQEQGVFTFHNDAHPGEITCSLPMAQLIVETKQKLAELNALLAEVGSVDAWVTLNAEPPTPDLIVPIARWRNVVLVGSGCTVSQLGAVMGVDDLGALRVVADLLRNHLVVCVDAAAVAAGGFVNDHDNPRRRWNDHEPVPVEPGDLVWPEDSEPAATSDEMLAHTAPAQPFADGQFGQTFPSEPTPLGNWAMPDLPGDPGVNPFGSMPEPALVAPSAFHDSADRPAPSHDNDLAAFASELANLSPRAARAMARAARATSVEERDEALAEIEAENGHLNRGMLLRFLGTMEP